MRCRMQLKKRKRYKSEVMSSLALRAILAVFFAGIASPGALAQPAYTPTITSQAGGALGTGNTVTGFFKAIGKTVHFRATVVIGAAGMGSATQVSVSLPSTAVSDCIVAAKNRTSGIGGVGDIGVVGLGQALLAVSSSGVLLANSETTIVSGTYEQA
jgi:hypothetical protein